MTFKGSFTASCLIAALMASAATRATADAGDAIAGALVGGIIGHAIARDQQRRTTTVVRRSYTPKSTVSSAQRESNRQMQVALNYFGFGAGAVDGSVGPGTRGAVSRYQAQMGYPTTGYIQPHEQNFLLSAFGWASSGGAATSGATTPQGQLIAYRQVMSGQPPQPQQMAPVGVAPTTVVVAPTPAPEPAPEPAAPQITAVATTPTPLPVEEKSAEAGSALPNFMGQSAGVSLASHCNRVSLLTPWCTGMVVAIA